jgi:hypothetical protein
MKIKRRVLLFITLGVLAGLINVDVAFAKYNWADYFSRNEIKSIKKAVKKSVRNELKHPDKNWKGIISQKTLEDGAIDYSKLNLTNSILFGDLASNGCTSGQVLKYNGTAWVCGADDNTGSTLGNSVESTEITDGTIVNADINAAAAIDSDKINFTNKNINLFGGRVIGDDSAEVLIGSSCGSGGDCASINKDKMRVNNHNVTDYSVELISSCTDGADYSCSTMLDSQPVIRFFNEGNANNILIGMRSGSNALVIENGDGNAYNGELRLGGIDVYGSLSAGSASVGGGSGEYLQFKNTSAGAPPAEDCDDDSERGRMSIDTTNNRLYICNGATRGWDYTSMID